jgi:hypothetical protein
VPELVGGVVAVEPGEPFGVGGEERRERGDVPGFGGSAEVAFFADEQAQLVRVSTVCRRRDRTAAGRGGLDPYAVRVWDWRVRGGSAVGGYQRAMLARVSVRWPVRRTSVMTDAPAGPIERRATRAA